MQNPTPLFSRSRYVESLSHDWCLNSKTRFPPMPDVSARKPSRSFESSFEYGGSWNRTGPRLAPSGSRIFEKLLAASADPFPSFRMWVIIRGALKEHLNASPVLSAQPFTVACLGGA